MNMTEPNRTGDGLPVFLPDFLLWATPYVVPSVLEPCLHQQCWCILHGFIYLFIYFIELKIICKFCLNFFPSMCAPPLEDLVAQLSCT